MAGKLLKLLVKHRRTGKQYMRYFKTRKGFNAAKKAGGTAAKKGIVGKVAKKPVTAASAAATKARGEAINQYVELVKQADFLAGPIAKMQKGVGPATIAKRIAKNTAERAKVVKKLGDLGVDIRKIPLPRKL